MEISTSKDLLSSFKILSSVVNLERTTDSYTNQDTKLSSTETTTLSDKINVISASTSSEQVNNKLITIPDTVDRLSTNTLKSSDHYSPLSNTTIATTDSKTTDKPTYYQTKTNPSILISSTEILNITSVAP
ncbi:unnamed protein product [Adineta steineri]|uniref:Uncharacterized protein n=1 Tax=Adineta steineri TaxID=433720 RepID=A0A819DKS1_9BILA|nr:unnamed protein product [Adineta steineri]